MSINKNLCDGNCIHCEANKCNWCIIKDISCPEKANDNQHETKITWKSELTANKCSAYQRNKKIQI